MDNYSFEYLRTLMNTNTHVQEFFAVSKEVRIRVNETGDTLIFSTAIKPNCLMFKMDKKKKR